MSERLAEEIFRGASESIDVLSPPIDEVVAEARELRRRRRRTVLASVTAGVLVVGVGTWFGTRPSDGLPDPPPAPVTQSRNPIDIPWYASGRLHLERVSVELPQVADLVGVDGGAVYADRSGTVSFVGPEGHIRVIGKAVVGTPVVASSDNGWAAWVGPGGGLVVQSLRTDELVGRLDVAEGARPVAIDQNLVYYTTPDGAFAWAPPGREPTRLERDGLLDVASATRVYQVAGLDDDGRPAGDRVEMVQSFFSVSFRRTGQGARLSPGGTWVLSRPPGAGDPGEPYRPVLYDTRSGDRLPDGLAPDEIAVDAAFGQTSDVVYLVARTEDLAAGPDLAGNLSRILVLRTCQLEPTTCSDVAPVLRPGGHPMLAD